MIEEETPKYIIELKTDLLKHMDQRFDGSEKKTERFVEKSINELAVMIKDTVATKDELEEVRQNMVTKDEFEEVKQNMATKSDMKEILNHIGRYEIRAQNIEHILLEDHKPRIAELEKVAFS